MMKILVLVLFVLMVSCQRPSDYLMKLTSEFEKNYTSDLPCEEKAAKFKRLSKDFEEFEKYGEGDGSLTGVKMTSLYCDFEALLAQGNYEQAYKMGMEILTDLELFQIANVIRAELAIIAKLLDRFPEYEQKTNLWENIEADKLKSNISYVVSHYCNDTLQRNGIPEWAATLEPPENREGK